MTKKEIEDISDNLRKKSSLSQCLHQNNFHAFKEQLIGMLYKTSRVQKEIRVPFWSVSKHDLLPKAC